MVGACSRAGVHRPDLHVLLPPPHASASPQSSSALQSGSARARAVCHGATPGAGGVDRSRQQGIAACCARVRISTWMTVDAFLKYRRTFYCWLSFSATRALRRCYFERPFIFFCEPAHHQSPLVRPSSHPMRLSVLRAGEPGAAPRRARAQNQSRGFLKASMISASGVPSSTWWLYSHRAVSGSDIRMLSMRPPVLRPKTVPRS